MQSLAYQRNTQLYCMRIEPAKDSFSNYNITYPEVGKIYRVRRTHKFKNDNRLFVMLKGIQNPIMKGGTEICFPSNWFVDLSQVDFNIIDEYMKIRKLIL